MSRIPTPPVLSTAVTGIGVIGSFLVTVASSAVIVGAIVSLGSVDFVTLTVDVNSALCPTLLTDLTLT